ncbi:MAG: branched-chain amino acid ABC transporter permease [Oscillibacter sp.]|nr:branched-chain amino acid ABC transporter permease [Oscillibacter sp.]
MTLKKKQTIFTAAVLLVLLLASMALDATLPSYHIAITCVKKATVYALVAVSMNLLNGFTGLFSLGQAGFMLLGAYAYGVLCIPVAKRAGVYQYFDGGLIQFSLPEIFAGFLGDTIGSTVGMLVALAIGGLLAAAMAYLIALPVLRLKSDYLAIATLGFAEILKAFFQWNALGPITNGSNLLKSYPSFEKGTSYILLAGAMIAIIVLLINSTYGRAFKAIRDDEVAAEAMGINLSKHKRLAFVISSFFAGVGGGMLAMYNGTIAAAPFKSALTYEILLIVVIGGIGSITGSVLASFLYIFSSEWLLRGLDSGTFLGINAPGIFKNGFRMAVFSVIIMIIVLFFRKGIMGDRELPDLLVRRNKKSRKEAAGK